MPRTAVYFDRDNTLIANDGYLGDPAGVRLIPGAANAIARARALGYAVVIISNQSGVARGMFTEADVHAVNKRMQELLLQENPQAVIDAHEFCPYHPQGTVPQYRQDSDLRKPKPGMILKARHQLALAPGGWCVGDAPRDIEAGKTAGCRTILVTIPDLPTSPAASESPSVIAPDFTANSLEQAMDIIERETRAQQNRPSSQTSPTAQTTSPAGPALSASMPASASDLAKLDKTLQAILQEVRRKSQPSTDFSISRLLAGILQILVLALLVLTYFNHRADSPSPTVISLLLAGVLQTLVLSLLVMGQQRN
jgi:D,D-heptose 1,7-bisphosphate phosphatase